MAHPFFPKHWPSKSIEADVWGWIRVRPMGPETLRPEKRPGNNQQEVTFALLWLWPQEPSPRALGGRLGDGWDCLSSEPGSRCDPIHLKGPWHSLTDSWVQRGSSHLTFVTTAFLVQHHQGTAFKSIWMDGIFCSGGGGRRGRRIYLLHRQFLWFLTRLSLPSNPVLWDGTHMLACYHSPPGLWIPFSLAVFLNPLYPSRAEVARAAGTWQRSTSLGCFWNTEPVSMLWKEKFCLKKNISPQGSLSAFQSTQTWINLMHRHPMPDTQMTLPLMVE